MGASRRHKGTDLRQQHNQSHLPHVGGFARHVGAGDNGRPPLLFAHVGVVGHKQGVRTHLLHHRMPSVPDLDDAGVVHRGAAVVVAHGHGGQGAKAVQLRHSGGAGLNAGHLPGKFCAQVGEQLVFQRCYPVGGGENVALQVFQLLGDVPLAVD